MLTQNSMLTQTSSKNLSIEVPQQDFDKINELVDDGLFDNVDDFLNESIRHKIQKVILKDNAEATILKKSKSLSD